MVSGLQFVYCIPMPGADHDAFHAPTSDDPWWQETAWFTFVVPERALTCYVYPWVRANQGILGGGVMVWDDRSHHAWQPAGTMMR